MRLLRATLAVVAALAVAAACAAQTGTPDAPPLANLDELAATLHSDPYDFELLISFGTSKGGSAGHLALSIRDSASNDEFVYSANFYADRDAKHATGYYIDDLIMRIPKMEYLYGTRSSLGRTAAFGLDYGEIYKRSVVGIRVYGVPAAEKEALATFFDRINADFHAGAQKTEYHDREIKYDYLRLNCAKTIGSAFRYGAGYTNLKFSHPRLLSGRKIVAAANANIPTEMALKLMNEWDARGYRMDALLYRKYPGSTYVDPRDEDKVAFKDLPDRFPSVLSRDFRRAQGDYEDVDNLFAMYLLYNLGKYGIGLDETTRRVEIKTSKTPMPYAQAVAAATEAARSDGGNYNRRAKFAPKGTRVTEDPVRP